MDIELTTATTQQLTDIRTALKVVPSVEPILDYPTLPVANSTAVGPRTNDLVAGDTIAIFKCCYLASTGKWLLARANAESTTKGLLAISLEAKNDTQLMNVALPGAIIRYDTWTWTIGGTIYLSDTVAGGLTQTAPTSGGTQIRIVGYALTVDSMIFIPENNWIEI